MKNGKHNWYSDRKQTTIWNYDKPKRNKNHPTSKPLDLLGYPISNSSQENGIVVDTFGGSGSTLMACEQTNRICYMMELDEKYASVILRRYDSYMFLIEHGDKRVLYTGDFRANGRSDYEQLLKELPTVDVLITEGTTLSRDSYAENIKEEELENIAVKYVGKHKGPVFFMMSAMNVDRLITAYNVAKRTDKLFLEDIYTSEIANATKNCMIEPAAENGIRVFITHGGNEEYRKLLEFGDAKIGKKQIAKHPFVMCIRQSMKNYLIKLNEEMSFEDGVLFYGMWKGYMDNPKVDEFLEFMKSLGVHIHVLHTSGHADAVTIEKMIEHTDPKWIIPVHTENAKWFDKYLDKIIVDESDVII